MYCKRFDFVKIFIFLFQTAKEDGLLNKEKAEGLAEEERTGESGKETYEPEAKEDGLENEKETKGSTVIWQYKQYIWTLQWTSSKIQGSVSICRLCNLCRPFLKQSGLKAAEYFSESVSFFAIVDLYEFFLASTYRRSILTSQLIAKKLNVINRLV